MANRPLEILYEDNHLLAVNKPAGLPTMGVAAESTSLFRLAQQYIKHRYDKPGKVYLGVVSRLDAATSGAVLFARTSKAAARLSEQFREREVRKTYWAILSAPIKPPAGTLVDWIVKDEAQQRMVACREDTPGAQQAELRYRTLLTLECGEWVEVELITGRKHQIRLQFALRGAAVCGEHKYGKSRPFAQGIALHARRLALTHPVRKEPIEIIAPVPATWKASGVE